MKLIGRFNNNIDEKKKERIEANEKRVTKWNETNEITIQSNITTTQSTVRNDVLFTTNQQHKQPQAVK